jgi:hypothetical protein
MVDLDENAMATSFQDAVTSPAITRRALIGAGLGTAGLVGMSAVADAQPVATPAAPRSTTGGDEDELLAVSELLVGGGSLPTDALPALALLVNADPALVAALPELRSALQVRSADALERATPDVQRLAGNILSFWYLGTFDGTPVPNRAEMFPALMSWQTLPYVTILTVCKGFGYWAQDVPVTLE